MRTIKEGIYSVGVIDWDRRLFDELIPLPDGTSYNSYLVKGGEKTALLDSVDPPFAEKLFENIKEAGAEKIDYIVCHHAEQDHSGSIGLVLEKFPSAKVITNEKCKQMLMSLLGIGEDKFQVISDGGEISLGNKTLRFIFTPWVHWPETMVSYLVEDKILFSCDFFGSHLAAGDLYVKDDELVLNGAKRYYAEIMMPFRGIIKSNIEKLNDLDIKIIAPSHGQLYDRPSLITDAYKKWIDDSVEAKVIIAYVSMHGSVKKMAEYLTDKLLGKNVDVLQFNLTGCDIGRLAIELVDAAAVVLASPTVLTGLHPSAAYAALLLNALRPKTKYIGIVGSFGWAGRLLEQAKSLLPNVKAELLEPVLAKGFPTEDDYKKLDALADELAKKIKN